MASPLSAASAVDTFAKIAAAVTVSTLAASLYALVVSPLYLAGARIESSHENAVLMEALAERLVAMTEARGLSAAPGGVQEGGIRLLRQGANSVVIEVCASSPRTAAALANSLALDALAGVRGAPRRSSPAQTSEKSEALPAPPPCPVKMPTSSPIEAASPSPYLLALRAKWRQWEKQEQASADDPLLAGLIREDAEIVRLRKELSAAELALRQSLTHLTPRHPDVKRLSGSVEALHAALEVRITGLIAEYRESLRREWTAAEAAERARKASPPVPVIRRAGTPAASTASAVPVAAATATALPMVPPEQRPTVSPLRLVLATPPSLPDGRWCRTVLLLGSAVGLLLGIAWSLIAAMMSGPGRLSDLLALTTLDRRLAALARK